MKDALKDVAIKDNLKLMKEEIGDVINGFVEAIDKTKADKKDLQELDKRVTIL